VAVKVNEKTSEIIYKNFVGGVAWAAGASVGFALLIGIIGLLLGKLGGLPIIGGFLASVVEVTQTAMQSRGVMIQ
jgi:hypothetical protein